jgi:hypothetical protein
MFGIETTAFCGWRPNSEIHGFDECSLLEAIEIPATVLVVRGLNRSPLLQKVTFVPEPTSRKSGDSIEARL